MAFGHETWNKITKKQQKMRLFEKNMAKNLQNPFASVTFVKPREDSRQGHLRTYSKYAYTYKAYPCVPTDTLSRSLFLAEKRGYVFPFSVHDSLTLTFERNAKKSKSRNRKQSSSADSSTFISQKSQRLDTMIAHRASATINSPQRVGEAYPYSFCRTIKNS